MILLKETNTNIDLYLDDREDPIYSISKDRLLEVNGENVSDWILQLLDKTWIDYDVLYKVAQTIVRLNPDNSIDWQKTFFMVEKKYYLDHVEDVNSEFEAEKPSNSLLARIKRGQEETNEFTSSKIHDITTEQLKKHKIL